MSVPPSTPMTGSGAGEAKMGPGPAKPAPGAGGEKDRMGMIQVNDLVYKLEPDMSVAVNRTYKSHFFQSTTYNNTQTAICIWNSGADYIDTRRSFLTFQIDIGAAADGDGAPILASELHGYFGVNGSAINVIDQITISSRSGDELCRINDLNQLCNIMIPLTYDRNWQRNTGSMFGYSDACYQSGHYQTLRTYAIPLYLLAPFFGYGRLMPAMLVSGLRVELRWATP